MEKTPNNTPEVANVALQMELCECGAPGTQTELIPTRTITTQSGFHADLVDVAAQIEDWTSHNREV